MVSSVIRGSAGSVLFNKGYSQSTQITIDFLCVCWFIPAIESGLFVTYLPLPPLSPQPLSQLIYQSEHHRISSLFSLWEYKYDGKDCIIDICWYLYLPPCRGGVCKVCSVYSTEALYTPAVSRYSRGVQALVSIDHSQDLGVHCELCMTWWHFSVFTLSRSTNG